MSDLDLLPTTEVVNLLLEAERRVVPAALAVHERIAAGADLV
ncbi:MAG: hypothetical protein QOJ78_1746, partial [Pseudonocardiales bacterium]|nr:hypothetical protein [Pseudonocardiales bacterium]